jgi:molybdopterin-biosynthesis enzyme MoeA-like protein
MPMTNSPSPGLPTAGPEFGIIIIGDEILSGKRADKHFAKAIEILKMRGLELGWARYLGDNAERITATLTHTFASGDIVFSFGGIGATPDDCTRQSAAAALGVSLHRHPDAVKEIEARFGADAYPRRVLMAEFPLGSTIIPNPYNRIAAFSVGDHHFLPGFPEMAWPMMEWVLDTRYAHLFHRTPSAEEIIVVENASESELLDLMNRIVANYPDLKLSSLPQFVPGGRIIELSVRGNPHSVPRAMAEIKTDVRALGFHFEEK